MPLMIPFDSTSENPREYSAQDWSHLFRSVQPTGVVGMSVPQSTSLKVTGFSDSEFHVSAGEAWLLGHYFQTGATSLPITLPDEQEDYSIVLRLDVFHSDPLKLVVKTGAHDPSFDLLLARAHWYPDIQDMQILDLRTIYHPMTELFLGAVANVSTSGGYTTYQYVPRAPDGVSDAVGLPISEYFDGLGVTFYVDLPVPPTGDPLGGVCININDLGDKYVKVRNSSGYPVNYTEFEQYKHYRAVYHGDAFYLVGV